MHEEAPLVCETGLVQVTKPPQTDTERMSRVHRYNAPIAGSFVGEEMPASKQNVPSLFHSHGGKAWVSNLTVQGDGTSPCGAVVVYTAAQLKFIGASNLCLPKLTRKPKV